MFRLWLKETKPKTSNQMQPISKQNVQDLKRIMGNKPAITWMHQDKSVLMCRQRVILVSSHLWAKLLRNYKHNYYSILPNWEKSLHSYFLPCRTSQLSYNKQHIILYMRFYQCKRGVLCWCEVHTWCWTIMRWVLEARGT